MHPSIAELLKLRDREPVAADVQAHVECCADCMRQLEWLHATRERLAAAPSRPADAAAWDRITAVAYAAPAGRPRRWLGRVAAAAAIVAVAGGAAWLSLPRQPSVAPAAGPAVVADNAAPGDIRALQRQSLQLENTLRSLRYHDTMMNARAANAIASLEDGIALIDYRLNQRSLGAGGTDTGAAQQMDTAEAARLWRQRVGLMRSLVTVRYVQASASR